MNKRQINLLATIVFLIGPYFSSEIVASPSVTACAGDVCAGLGKGYDLRSINVLDPLSQSAGMDIFLNTAVGTCSTITAMGASEDEMKTYSSSEQITKSMSAGLETNNNGVALSYGGYSLKATAQATFSQSFDSTTNLAAANYFKSNIHQVVTFDRDSSDCWSAANLQPAFLKSFEALAPIDPTLAKEDSSWQPYVDFLAAWGSHVQIQQQQGSRISFWSSSTDTSATSSKQLSTKVCADIGIGAIGSIGACSKYTNDIATVGKSNAAEKKVYIVGGDDTTRLRLSDYYSQYGQIEPERLSAFMTAGNTSAQPIGFAYTPIWGLLTQIYQPKCTVQNKGGMECLNYQRALALQAAYQGYMAFQCSLKVDNNKIPYQQMVMKPANSLGVSSFACQEAKSGCRTDKDCKYTKNGFLGLNSGGNCAGGGCIQAELIPGTSPSLYRAQIKTTDQSVEYNKGTNASCSNARIPACDTAWDGGAQEREIWNQAVNGPGSGNTTAGVSKVRVSGVSSNAVAEDDPNENGDDSPDTHELKVVLKKQRAKSMNILKVMQLWYSKRKGQDLFVSVRDKSTSAKSLLNCPGVCEVQYQHGKTIDLMAIIPKGFRLIGWEGDECQETFLKGTGAHCHVLMDSSKTVELLYE